MAVPFLFTITCDNPDKKINALHTGTAHAYYTPGIVTTWDRDFTSMAVYMETVYLRKGNRGVRRKPTAYVKLWPCRIKRFPGGCTFRDNTLKCDHTLKFCGQFIP